MRPTLTAEHGKRLDHRRALHARIAEIRNELIQTAIFSIGDKLTFCIQSRSVEYFVTRIYIKPDNEIYYHLSKHKNRDNPWLDPNDMDVSESVLWIMLDN